MAKKKPIQIKEIYHVYENNTEQTVNKIRELIALAMLEHIKKQ